MTFTGHIQNGVVVLDGGASLPEGTPVTILLNEMNPAIEKPIAGINHIDFPIVRDGHPGTWNLTQERMAEIQE